MTFILWLTLLIIFLILITNSIILSKQVVTIKKSNVLFHTLSKGELINSNSVCLFLTYENKNNDILIIDAISKYNGDFLYIFFRGPEWQKNSINKKIPELNNLKIILDEKGKLSASMGIHDFPSYLILDKEYIISEKGKYFV
ncbi:hypothetical protein [Rossellomorea arthrocnemi]|uniref:hypothetical protein n=1 Tax=Rossellomorea arthrocnemi TaxID=2769542 RepID=UPI001918FD70|nr:hypothetical protein [Rossellomorea arthrocnemi]